MKIIRGAGLGLVALFSWFGQVQGQAQVSAPAVSLAELVGTWAGHPVSGTPDTATWHLVLGSDSTYVWKSHADFGGAGRERERPQPGLALRGDTLTLGTQSYTVQLKRRQQGQPQRQYQELWLSSTAPAAHAVPAGGAGGAGPVFRLERDWLGTVVTGQPLKCRNSRLAVFACANVEVLSYLPNHAIANAAGYDLWGWHDSATGREFLVSGGASTAFIEVTDPVRPRYLGVLPPHDSATRAGHGAYSVKVYQHYAFIGYEGALHHGLQIFDLTQLRKVRTPQTFQETAHYAGLGSTHTLTLNPVSGFLYANGSNTCGGGLHMIDVRTPTQPVFAGCFADSTKDGSSGLVTYVHDAQCVTYRGPDRAYHGREICVTYDAGQNVSIVDVTDKHHPKAISHVTYPKAQMAHQGWFTTDHRYVFLDDEGDESAMAGYAEAGLDTTRTRTIGLDLMELADPVVLVEYYNPNSRNTDHNLFIRGHYIYQGNNGSGLQILDIADPKLPKTVGYLSPRHWDASDRQFKNGQNSWVGPTAWGTYPYFSHGVVAVSMTTGVVLARLLQP